MKSKATQQYVHCHDGDKTLTRTMRHIKHDVSLTTVCLTMSARLMLKGYIKSHTT